MPVENVRTQILSVVADLDTYTFVPDEKGGGERSSKLNFRHVSF